MPVDPINLVVDLQNDHNTAQEECCEGAVAYERNRLDLVLIVDVSRVGCSDSREREVHADDPNAHDESAQALRQSDLPSEAEVRGQQENEAYHAEK